MSKLRDDALENRLQSLTTFRTTRTQLRAAILTGLVIALFSLGILPFAQMNWIRFPSFLPIVMAIGMCSELYTSYVLIRQFHMIRTPSLAILAAAYLYIGLLSIPLLLTFPGVFHETGLFGATPQSSAWLWVFRNLFFPLGIFCYLLVDRLSGDRPLAARTANRFAVTLFVSIFGAVVLLTAAAVRLDLPLLIEGNAYRNLLTSGVAPLLLGSNLLAFLLLWYRTRGRTVLQLWLILALFAMIMDVTLTLFSGGRYSIGWYSSRLIALFSGTIVLGALIYEINRLYYNLQESEQRFRSLFQENPDAVYAIDLMGRFRSANPACEKITGYPLERFIGRDFTWLLPAEDRERVYRHFLSAAQGEPETFETKLPHADGHLITLNINNLPIVVDGRIVGVYGIARDITESKRAEATIEHLAYHDALTGLANRRLFKKKLTAGLEEAKRSNGMLAVLYLDLDRFKIINDTFGHDMGDLLLEDVTERLQSCVRDGDVIARMGGDEFTLLLPKIRHADDAQEIARRILAALQKPIVLSGQDLHITTSIGIALYPSDGASTDTLMRHADTAMYRAKEQGKNNCQFYSAAMNAQAFQRLTLENDLRKALEKDEFTLYYQPQIDARTGEMTGAEALIRWQHPERGLVSPAAFIPLAEESGLILPLGRWVLRTACRQNRQWQEAGLPPVRIAVNLSMLEFEQPDFLQTVDEVLAETGLSPRWLELEITESIAMRRVDRVLATLQELHSRGVEVAIDDFGTGYSSLGYLRNFPVQRLKIDQSFVRAITHGEEERGDAGIVAAIIAMAQSLQLDTVAEGVETPEQLAFLQGRGCHQMQGYHFYKPMPAADLARCLAEQEGKKTPRQ